MAQRFRWQHVLDDRGCQPSNFTEQNEQPSRWVGAQNSTVSGRNTGNTVTWHSCGWVSKLVDRRGPHVPFIFFPLLFFLLIHPNSNTRCSSLVGSERWTLHHMETLASTPNEWSSEAIITMHPPPHCLALTLLAVAPNSQQLYTYWHTRTVVHTATQVKSLVAAGCCHAPVQ